MALTLATVPAAGCGTSDGHAQLDAGEDGPTTQPSALVAPVLNSYDPSLRGSFPTTRASACGAFDNWTVLEDEWEVWTGLVTAGHAACDAADIANGCGYPPNGVSQNGYQRTPKYSEADWSGNHDGRDLNIAFLPTDWTRTMVNRNVALPDQSVTVDVEIEAEYFWPTVNWWDNRFDGAVFREGVSPGGATTYREAWNLPTPQPGDQIVFNGLHVRDDCHSKPAEIHPPQASTWLRKVGSHDYDLTFNAASHSFRPVRGLRADLPGEWYWFRLHDASVAPVVTYAGDNWLVDPVQSYTAFSGFQPVRTCNDGSGGSTPDAIFAGGNPCRAQLGSHRRVNEFFDTYTTHGVSSGVRYVGVHLGSKPGTENSAGLSVLGSGTYRVCQPHPSNGYCAPRLPTFKQVSQGITPKRLRVNLKNFNSGLWGDFEYNDNVSGRRFQQYGHNGGNGQTFNLEHVTTDGTGPIFKIQNYNGRYFDTFPNASNGAPVYQDAHVGDAWQQWRFIPVGGSGGVPTGYNIKNVQSGRCLAIPGASTAAGVDAVLWDCVGQADTIWHLADKE